MDWWMWLAGGLVLLVIELVTPSGFFVMFFGLGALTVGVLARLDLVVQPWLHWLLFTATSIVYLLLFRGRLQKRFESPPVKAVDTLVGELAVPQERMQPGAIGRAETRGTIWTAQNDSAHTLEPGQRCRVVRIDQLLLGIAPE
jgi:membrane protein implicated in regulation of membrane protease activity